MSSNEAPDTDTVDCQIAWDADGCPFSTLFEDIYFSRLSGIDESRYVFIDQNDLRGRWARLPPQVQFVIGETGFGTGLNFLLTWQHWRKSAPVSARLHFVSVEKYPLSRAQLQRSLALWPQLAGLAHLLLAAYPAMPCRGFQRLVFDNGRVSLTLILDDALQGLRQLLPALNPGPMTKLRDPTWAGTPLAMDAWFLDGFDPAKNPDMWSLPIFQTLARLSKPGSTFATFSAGGTVKCGLAQAGFVVSKVAGYRRKRDMLCGQFQPISCLPSTFSSTTDGHTWPAPAPSATSPATTRSTIPTIVSTTVPAAVLTKTPATIPVAAPAPVESCWHTLPRAAVTSSAEHQIIVIGGGLAGSHSARTLADYGYSVILLEKGRIASGASGNAQGVVYAKASSQEQPLTHFNLTALQFACRYYQTRTGYVDCGAASGVLHLAQTASQIHDYRAIAARYQQTTDFVCWVDPQDTHAVCGIPLKFGGLLFPQAGWLDPARLCRQLLNHPRITVKERHPVEHLIRTGSQWQVHGIDGETLAQAPTVVIANASDALHLAQTGHLPVKPIRGQVSEHAATPESRSLTRVLCAEGYIAPAYQSRHCLGASFNLHSSDPTPDTCDDASNLAKVACFADAFRSWTHTADSRVSFRCASPDYLPLVGPAPVADEFIQRFTGLRRNARCPVDDVGCYYPGLFINIGHGSRGLAYTPLCAELLASMIAGAPLPLARDMVTRLHPARFLVRDLKRNRI